ncbi:MAG: hypothetical protein C4B57_00175 [Deltaproteobacteria bacterium]|nr:MAG: hypothetical protein C4B57_00175 [Deltaproteobacteria bacterium]
MGKDEETEIAIECHAAQAPALRVGIGYFFHSTLNVRCSMFDVHLSKNKNLFSAFEVHNLG